MIYVRGGRSIRGQFYKGGQVWPRFTGKECTWLALGPEPLLLLLCRDLPAIKRHRGETRFKINPMHTQALCQHMGNASQVSVCCWQQVTRDVT